MLDFLIIKVGDGKKGTKEIYPDYAIIKSKDLMIRGRDFYAIWVEDRGLWSTEEQDAIDLIDKELDIFAKTYREEHPEFGVRVLHIRESGNRKIQAWHQYVKKDMRDNFHMLDETLTFSNSPTNKNDFASKRLSYPLAPCPIDGYETLMSVLYSPEERHKLEWAIGSIVSGDSKWIQKFIVLYGSAGTGKSTVLNIIQELFKGYYSTFDSKALGSSSAQFALEPFKTNPLVALQHDGDLSRIEDNTRLNSLVSHEFMTVNEKYLSAYMSQFKCFLFLGTNKPVKITDAKSGLIRRLIDVSPTGNKLRPKDYNAAVKKIEFELGGIASHCLEVYESDPGAYDDYIPLSMLSATNDFYNFVLDSYFVFKQDDSTTLKAAWEMYKAYCDDAKVSFPYSQRIFKEELKNYFRDYKERHYTDNGVRVHKYYSGFRFDKFEDEPVYADIPEEASWLTFKEQSSALDVVAMDWPAQYATDKGSPMKKWENVKTTLKDINTGRLHYLKTPTEHIFVDFDLRDENGEKSLERNIEAASKWPRTYAELSKSGQGIHLHYIYTGDTSKLSAVYDEHIEVKVSSGNSSLRRKLTKCNDISIAEINSGLPMKEEKKVIDFESLKNEKAIRTLVKKNLNKEIHADTTSSINFIHKILEDAYNSGVSYDISDMHTSILAFAAGSTNQSAACIKKVGSMKFKSKEEPVNKELEGLNDETLIFFDVEVFPNLFLVNWHVDGSTGKCIRMINPRPESIEELIHHRLVGFNNRRYDNHMLYGCLIGKTPEQLYQLSTRIISGDKTAFFGEAYNLSYTDIYDFSSKKQSLKQWEIDLGINHLELSLPWDQPVPKELWEKVAEYCDNDVLSTEALFHSKKIQADFTARKILADVAGMTVNDTTNSLTTKIIFGNNRNPQSQFNYRDMGHRELNEILSTQFVHPEMILLNHRDDEEFTCFNKDGMPIFPGYKFEKGVSIYRGEEVGEGGYVYAEPGMYGNVALLDIASMHPSSIRAENLFGDEYTQRFVDILEARIAIKHKDFNRAKSMLNGALAGYLNDPNVAKDLAQALKIAINSVYGLTSAKFPNPFKDPRNVDNIVAKRGALFMINLKHEVQRRGFKVAHIKTDSIKIPDATPDIIQFVIDYGKLYGYNFEHEATYDRMCLVNNAVYIAKYATVEHCCELYGEEYVNSSNDILGDCKEEGGTWTATGTQFQVPYVFKTLFTHDDIQFKDLCESKSVKSSLYLDYVEPLKEGEHNYQFVGRVGQFCPMKPGTGGGILYRQSKGKNDEVTYSSVTGTKGYFWLESERVKSLGKENDIDRSYYNALVDDAIASISEYGDYAWFVSDDPYVPYDTPPWEDPEEDIYEAQLFDKR